MKINFVILISVVVAACGGSATEQKQPGGKPAAMQYGKDDLKKIIWIEGKWKGMYKGEPFYEIYRFINDSTLESISYEWNGVDSSKTDRSYIIFKNGAYYLGDKQNWKVSSITENEIRMLPNVDAHNDVVWTYKDSTSWDAVLTDTKGKVTTYNMKYFDPFKK